MKKLRAWFASPAGKRFFNIAYSLGAAIVILGAMLKVIHVSYADYIFIIGMSVEAAIFFLSAFDTSTYDNAPVTIASRATIDDSIQQYPTVDVKNNNVASTSGTMAVENSKSAISNASAGGTSGTVVLGGGQSGGSNLGTVVAGAAEVANSGGNSGSSIIVVNGGGSNGENSGINTASVGSNVGGSANTGGQQVSHSNNITSGVSSSNTQPSTVVGDGGNINISTQEYSQSVSNAAQNLEDFSKTMQSLNESSQILVDAYKQIAEAQNMSETMNTVKYINDSLSRIKNLYDGAIGDSYMFKEEMSKMTRHIEALNSVYARLLQAMTANGNNNPNNNPPIY